MRVEIGAFLDSRTTEKAILESTTSLHYTELVRKVTMHRSDNFYIQHSLRIRRLGCLILILHHRSRRACNGTAEAPLEVRFSPNGTVSDAAMFDSSTFLPG